MYLASRLTRDLDEHFSSKEFLNKTMKYAKLTEAFSRILRPLDAKFRIVKDKSLIPAPGTRPQLNYAFSGWFDMDKKTCAVVVNLHVDPSKTEFKMTPAKYNTFRFLFSQVTQHEFIHKSQYEFRPDQSERSIKIRSVRKLSPQRMQQIQYLSQWCEIDAHAHDIAMEIKQYYPAVDSGHVIARMESYSKLSTYRDYTTAFRGIEWTPLRRALVRKVWRWAQSAQAVPGV